MGAINNQVLMSTKNAKSSSKIRASTSAQRDHPRLFVFLLGNSFPYLVFATDETANLESVEQKVSGEVKLVRESTDE